MHFDEVGQRPCLHFLHDPRAVDFHRTLTDAQLVRDNLVGFTGYDQVKDLTLAIRQATQTVVDDSVLLLLFTTFLVRCQGLADTIE